MMPDDPRTLSSELFLCTTEIDERVRTEWEAEVRGKKCKPLYTSLPKTPSHD